MGDLNEFLEEEGLRSIFYAYPILLFWLPLTGMMNLLLVSLSMFFVCLDSQYGMIRVLMQKILDSYSLAGLLLISLVTPILLGIPAYLYFSERDISE